MTHRSAVSVALATALVVSSACAKGDSRATDSAAGTAQALAQTGTPPTPPPPLRGALTKPIASYTYAEFRALVDSMQFTGDSVRTRRCQGNAGCNGASPSRTTRLAIAAAIGVDSLAYSTIPQYGVVAAKSSNLGGLPDLMYGMRPGARYVYYLIVLPPANPGGTPTWQLEQVDTQGSAPSISSLVTGRFRGCNDHPYQAGARADFKACSNATSAKPASLSTMLQGGDPPMWIGCAMGCCVSETGLQG